jgi:glycine cleavage system H protein
MPAAMSTYYTTDHEWITLDGSIATVGITDHAQQTLGDLVFVSLPTIGQSLAKGDSAATVESVKAASDVYAPLTGTIVEINAAVVADPALINSDPMHAGWLFRIRFSVPAEVDSFLSEQQYQASLP